jgi:hypothetical protein
LAPLSPGERPWPITVGALIAALNGVVQLVLFIVGVKLKVGGTGFQALLAIVILTFALVLVRASSVLGAVISVAVVAGGGFLFFKLVRVLSRIQMPKYPGSS